MKTQMRTISVLLLAVLLLASCGFGSETREGTVRLAVTQFSPALYASLNSGSKELSPQSRTFLVADKVVFTLYKGGFYHSNWEVTPNAINAPGGAEVSSVSLQAGTDYYVYADVYNLSNDTSLQHTARGEVGFSIATGMNTDVFINCVPENSYYGSEDLVSPVFSLPQTFTYTVAGSVNTIVDSGSEQWFAFWPSTGSTRVTIEPEPGHIPTLMAVPFSYGGTYLGGEQDLFAGPGETLEFTINNPTDQYCYIGIMDGVLEGQTPATLRSFTVYVERVATVQDTPIASDGTYATFPIGQEETRYFYFDIPTNKAYVVGWQDSLDGDPMSYDADVQVYVYEGNFGADRSQITGAIAGADSGYTTHLLVPLNAVAYRRIWVEVTGTMGGDFGLMAREEIPPDVANLETAYNPYVSLDFMTISGIAMDFDGLEDLAQIDIACYDAGLSWVLYNGSFTTMTSTSVYWELTVDVSSMPNDLVTTFYVQATDRAGAQSPVRAVDFDKATLGLGIE